MYNPLSLYIGIRYTRSRKGSRFISLVSWFSMVGMALGVFALVVVLSVMNGFDREIKNRLLKLIPHGYLHVENGVDRWQAAMAQAEKNPHVLAAAPYIKGRALLTAGDNQHGVELVGVHPQEELKVSELARVMRIGALDDLPGYGLILGRISAAALKVQVGDYVTAVLPQISVTPAGYFPRYKRFKVVGIFEAGAQVDAQLALIYLQDARRFFRFPAQSQGLRIKVDNQQQAPEILNAVAAKFSGPVTVQPWQQSQGSLFAAIAMEKRVTGLLLSLIILVAGFNIVSSLVMSVSEKRHDIAVLRTIGASRNTILQIFLIQGMATGLIGAAVGLCLALPTAIYLPEIFAALEKVAGAVLFDPRVFFISRLPSELRWEDVSYTLVLVFSLNLLATLYPAWKASQVPPAAALEYH